MIPVKHGDELNGEYGTTGDRKEIMHTHALYSVHAHAHKRTHTDTEKDTQTRTQTHTMTVGFSTDLHYHRALWFQVEYHIQPQGGNYADRFPTNFKLIHFIPSLLSIVCTQHIHSVSYGHSSVLTIVYNIAPQSGT